MATSDLSFEWSRYRHACERVDLIRYHPAFNSGADLGERLHAAETLSDFLEGAINASKQLMLAAEQSVDIEQYWLHELRDVHAELHSYQEATQEVIGETEQRLRPPELR